MKTYVLTLSKVFPRTHARAGEPTEFREKFLSGEKIHTIRANYILWVRRINDIQAGNAVLSIRQWTGKPYRSKQVEIARLTAKDGIGIQILSFDKDRDGVPSLKYFNISGKYIDREILANNDGLTLDDWREWFKGYDLSKPMAIIHFTQFRY